MTPEIIAKNEILCTFSEIKAKLRSLCAFTTCKDCPLNDPNEGRCRAAKINAAIDEVTDEMERAAK